MIVFLIKANGRVRDSFHVVHLFLVQSDEGQVGGGFLYGESSLVLGAWLLGTWVEIETTPAIIGSGLLELFYFKFLRKSVKSPQVDSIL